ncbi:hypothetical protein [Pseudorhodoferax sp. Leaf267]|uniref:hypothetical protein n=1 Tax=Pseudorhodoferax sp. Leaf267 TaxID=1736316 RepID=UPI0006F399E3|nr:hypothetical protein [Pseudorhodoferax sp. Leaf267]KQP11944.1 hypothetical protein ASF43_23655 [Pseudorhodoferax sp. Leaf267]
MKNVWSNTLAWFAAVALALFLAVAAPTESSVMGRLPTLQAKFLDQRPLALPGGLASDRTLALISFHRDQRPDVESWIQGMQLGSDPSIRWLRIPVVNDPGSDAGRSEIEARLLAHYATDAAKTIVAPVFTDRSAFVRSAGLSGTERPYVMVVNRRGDVLARVVGKFDPVKAETLRATLRGE